MTRPKTQTGMCMVLGNQPKTPKDNLQSEQNSKEGEKGQDMEKHQHGTETLKRNQTNNGIKCSIR